MNAPVGFQSICSGIDAASVAWEPLGWRCVGFSEIEKFPRAVLAHRWPDVPLHGDFRALIDSPPVDADVLVGGTPCQAFSLAGLRLSLQDERGNLSLEFVRLANAIDAVRRRDGRAPCVVAWENVPGVLSVDDNAFGCFLAALVGEDTPLVSLGGGKWPDSGLVVGPERAAAWRVLDAQYFGLPQRRRRVFVVASARDGFDPGSILFEPEGRRRHHPPSRQAGERVAATLDAGLGKRCGTPNTGGDLAGSLIPEVAHTLRAEGHDASEDGTGRGVPLIAAEVAATLDSSFGKLQGASGQDANHGHSHLIAFSSKDFGADADEISPTLRSMNHSKSHANAGGQIAVAFDTTQITSTTNRSNPRPGDPCHPLAAGAHPPALFTSAAVRRLTPRECERLQGFPDDHTLVPWRKGLAPDGPRYKALGNSMAVPVMRWIGERLQLFVFGVE